MTERVVFDTNVWVSGLLWRGKPYRCLLLARSGLVKPVYCQAMVDELLRKLQDKFGFSEDRLKEVKADLFRIGESVEISGALEVVSNDPDDDKFIECALLARASLVVSGDRHLLDLQEYEGIHVVSPAEFLRVVSEER